ncbi:MAG TPA: hypothetical protein DDY68_01475 [Porphyromonadaceae bacterium]|nr:hypothetical protein [Porphyromonadaceae bacterium]
MEEPQDLSIFFHNDHIFLALLLFLILLAISNRVGILHCIIYSNYADKIKSIRMEHVEKELYKGSFSPIFFLQMVLSFGVWFALYLGGNHTLVESIDFPLIPILLWGGGLGFAVLLWIWIRMQQWLISYIEPKQKEELLEWLASYVVLLEKFGVSLMFFLLPVIYLQGTFMYVLWITLSLWIVLKVVMIAKGIKFFFKEKDRLPIGYGLLYVTTFEIVPLMTIYGLVSFYE